MAIVLAAFTIPYGALQLVVGPLGDRIGKPRVLVFALVGYALATAGCAFAASLTELTLLRAAAGACSAGLIPVCLAYIADGTSYEVRQITLSRFLTGVVLAQMLAGPVGGAFGQFVSWRGVFLLLSAAALALAALFLLRLDDLSQKPPGQSVAIGTYAGLLQPGPRRLLLATLVDGGGVRRHLPLRRPLPAREIRLALRGGRAGARLFRDRDLRLHRRGAPVSQNSWRARPGADGQPPGRVRPGARPFQP